MERNFAISQIPLDRCVNNGMPLKKSNILEDCKQSIGFMKKKNPDLFDENVNALKQLIYHKRAAFTEWQNNISSKFKTKVYYDLC